MEFGARWTYVIMAPCSTQCKMTPGALSTGAYDALKSGERSGFDADDGSGDERACSRF
jgi:hypothetical protein